MKNNILNITIKDITKLRNITGAGIMSSKEALIKCNGDIEKAIEFLRKKGQKIAANLSHKKSEEGVVIAKINETNTKGLIMSLKCETDFVSKNKNFIEFANFLAKKGLEYDSKENFLNSKFENLSILDRLINQTAILGEKIEIDDFKKISAPFIGYYIHTGNKIASIVGLSHKVKNAKKVGREIAMQVVAMNPLGLDIKDIDNKIIQNEISIAKELLEKEKKPIAIIDKIINAKITKFCINHSLINQEFIIHDKKQIVKDYLFSISEELKITSFIRVSLK